MRPPAPTAAASSLVSARVFSQESGRTGRQFNGHEAPSVTMCTVAATGPLPTWPCVPEYYRGTQAEAIPSF